LEEPVDGAGMIRFGGGDRSVVVAQSCPMVGGEDCGGERSHTLEKYQN
jgi:hypothetical protein